MASGSRGRCQESAGSDALDTLTSPDLALLPAVDLVVRLNRDERSGTDFADVALVLAVRERRLAEAEDRVRAVDVVAAGLRDRIRALELRAANAEALARRKRNSLGSESDSGGISGAERAVAREDDHQSQAALEPQIQAVELIAGKRKQEPAAGSAFECKEQQPLKKKPKPAGALGVASDSEDSDTQVEEAEEELHFIEAQGWKRLNILKAQVAAWESVYDAADAAQGMLQLQAAATPPPVDEVQTVIQAEAKVARLQEKIILCERRLEEIKNRAEKNEERLCAEITECKEKATKTEAILWEEILLARSRAVTELEVWKHSAAEAQAQIRAAATTVARLCDEVEAWKHRASETETRLQTQDKIIGRLQDEVVEGECKLVKAECRIRVSDEHAVRLQDKIEETKQDSAIEVAAQTRRATMIEEHLRAKIRTLELKVTNLEARGSGSDISRSDHTVVIDEHGKSPMVSEIGVRRVVPTGATKIKAQRQKGVSFYDKIFKSEMEKNKLIGNEENELRLKKQAAVIASKELYLRCWSQAPYLPSQLGSQTTEDDSGEDDSSEDDSGEEA